MTRTTLFTPMLAVLALPPSALAQAEPTTADASAPRHRVDVFVPVAG